MNKENQQLSKHICRLEYIHFVLFKVHNLTPALRDGAVSPASSPKLTKAKGTSLSRDAQIFLSPALFGDLITFEASWEAWSPTYPGCLLQSPSSSDQSWSDTWTTSAGSFRCEGVPPRWQSSSSCICYLYLQLYSPQFMIIVEGKNVDWQVNLQLHLFLHHAENHCRCCTSPSVNLPLYPDIFEAADHPPTWSFSQLFQFKINFFFSKKPNEMQIKMP